MSEAELREQIARRFYASNKALLGDMPWSQTIAVGTASSYLAYSEADRILSLIKEAGYLPVEPVQLEVLEDEEIQKATGAPMVLSGHRRLVQATITYNEEKGQLYRVKE